MPPSSSTILAGTRARQVSHNEVVWPRKRYGADLRAMPSYIAAPAADHGGSVQDQAEANHMEEVERADHGCIWFEKFPHEALQRVPPDREVETVAEPEGIARPETQDQHDEHRRDGKGFVELPLVAGDSVTEVDAPRQCSRRAVGEVGEAGEEAAPAAHRHRGGEGRGEDDAGRARDAGEALEGFDRRDGARDAAHHGEAQRM